MILVQITSVLPGQNFRIRLNAVRAAPPRHERQIYRTYLLNYRAGKYCMRTTSPMSSTCFDRVGSRAISEISNTLGGSAPKRFSIDAAVVAVWGDVKLEKIDPNADEYREIKGVHRTTIWIADRCGRRLQGVKRREPPHLPRDRRRRLPPEFCRKTSRSRLSSSGSSLQLEAWPKEISNLRPINSWRRTRGPCRMTIPNGPNSVHGTPPGLEHDTGNRKQGRR